jgi:ABC-2 type transport system ATP-binding protein
MSDPVISVKNLHKTFKLPREKANGLKQTIINFTRGKRGYETQHVLRGLDFEIARGDFFGIVGRNGSGKSTLLKILAQIYQPDKGSVAVKGSLVPFIELGVGFNPELTGRENVYMNGALLGFSNAEVDKMYHEIVEFAELERFMDQKLKNYSSGMQVRLAFSIAIRADSDILLLDEVLAVGDADFQRKCYEYFAQLKKKKRTVILVTHSMDAAREYCDRAILLDQGEIVAEGDANKVANQYLQLFNKATVQEGQPSDRWGTGEVKVENFRASLADTLRIEFNLVSTINCRDVIAAIRIMGVDGTMIAGMSTKRMVDYKKLPITAGGKKHIEFKVPNLFGRKTIELGFHIVSGDGTTVFDSWDGVKKLVNPKQESFYPVVFDEGAEII